MSIPPTSEEAEDDKASRVSAKPEPSFEDGLIPASPATTFAPAKPGKVTSLDAARYSIETASGISSTSTEENRTGRTLSSLTLPFQRHVSRSPAPPKTWKDSWHRFWQRNRGVALVLLAQFFGALMNVTTRLLETDGDGMDPMQILFGRMTITAVLCCSYMWYTNIPDFPFGKSEVRALLVARGLSGFFGVFGLYYSLMYLPMAEATVLTFLAPIVTCWVCAYLLKEPFTRTEQIAGLVSLAGVVLISHPVSFFSHSEHDAPPASGGPDGAATTNNTVVVHGAHDLASVTPGERLGAVGVSMLGVLGAAGAYTTIRWIGKRAHPLISVNYFATWCTIVSTLTLLTLPNISFKLPSNAKEWGYLFFLGICGFVMQFLLTAGLTHEKSSRATNMVYTQMLFALSFDKIIWGTTPGAISIIGSSLILGSAIYVALQKGAEKQKPPRRQGASAAGGRDEERGLVDGMDATEEEVEREEEGERRESLRGVQEVQLRTLRN
ncbi:MAG: hypothetical protein M1837_004766 [Sclerophora amabilis]|nr:MAG: hypothetical protein M1837_004766 [Sclerophora amabilis]